MPRWTSTQYFLVFGIVIIIIVIIIMIIIIIIIIIIIDLYLTLMVFKWLVFLG